MELLYADDLVLIVGTRSCCWRRFRNGKRVWKELRVNFGKTKLMKCEARLGPTENLRKWPCGGCRKGVDSNSIKCNQCSQWIHGRCSGCIW